MEQRAAAEAHRGPGGPDVDRLRKDVHEYKRLADTYREQRDKLQEQ